MSETVKYLPYALTLKAPAIVTTLSGDPNSTSTQLFIPGSVMRGAFAAELVKSQASEDEFRQLVLDGNVRFLHAYPASGSTRSLPTPIPWRTEKGETTTKKAFDLAAFTGRIDANTQFDVDQETGELETEPDNMWPTVPLQWIEYPFVAFFGSTPTGVKVRTDARSHQQRDRKMGRSWKDKNDQTHGALFVYEYLEPDQTFRGIIQVSADSEDKIESILDLVKRSLDKKLILIGRSRRAGYGGAATIDFDDSPESHEVDWGDVQREDVPANSFFRVYFLSAGIARDSLTGQVDPCALPNLLVKALGGEHVVNFERTLWEFEALGGFNRKWQLEVPQALAVRAGSVFVLRAKQEILASTLRAVEHGGLGERQIEGFGRIVFLKESNTKELKIEISETAQKSGAIPPKEIPELVKFLQRRLIGAAISRSLDREVKEIVGDLRSDKIPSASLLGRLRIPLRSGDAVAGITTLQQWLDDKDPNTALKEEAMKQLRDCRLASALLSDWLLHTVNSAIEKRSVMRVVRHRKNQLGAGAALAESQEEAMAVQNAARLIDAVLATLAQKARRRESDQSS